MAALLVGLRASSRRRGITCRAMWLASASATARYTGLPGWKPSLAMVSRFRCTSSSSSVDTSPQRAARSSGPGAQRAVVALRVGAGHPAQRLRQGRKLMDRRQRAEHHVLRAGAVAQQVGDRFARPHRAQRADLVDDIVDAGNDDGQIDHRQLAVVQHLKRLRGREAGARAAASNAARAAHLARQQRQQMADERVVLCRHADAGRRRVARDQQAQSRRARRRACLRAHRRPRAGAAHAPACATPAPPAADSTRA